MKLFFVLFAVVAWFLPLASAQAQEGQACTWTSDCLEGYQCASDRKCHMGAWPNGGCTWDSDCLDGYRCNDGACRMGSWPNGGCTWDSDCLDGYRCNDGACRMGSWPNGGCTWDSDCVTGYVCGADHECVFEDDRRRTAGRACAQPD